MRHTRDLTRGSIPRELTELMLPLLLGNILQQTYNTADAWIIGRWVGREAFAAIGVAGTVMNLLIFVLSGACAGVSVLFSQFYGAEDLAAFRREGHLALRWGTAVSAGLGLAALPLLSPLLWAIRTPSEVLPYCRAYLVIVTCGLPATYLYNLFAAMLRSVGNTLAALVSLLAAMAANVALDLLLTARLGWGVRGAAAATVLSQAMAAGLCWLYFRRALPELLPLSLALSAALYVPALPAVAWLSGDSGVVAAEGAAYLRTIAVFYPLCYVGNVFVGWFRGRGQVNVPAAGTALHISLRVVLSYLLIGGMGLRAVAVATGLGWVLVVSFQTVVFFVTDRRKAHKTK